MAQARSFFSSWSTSLFHSMCCWSNCLLLVLLSRKKIDLLALAAALMMMMKKKKKKKRLLLFHKPWLKTNFSLSPHRPNPNPKSKQVQFPSEYPKLT
jgi:hypothetical protein